MKKLSQYLNENNSRIFEGTTLQYFMLNYESDGKEEGVEEYFKRHNLLKDGRIKVYGGKGKYITLEEIKAVYEYAAEHDMPCPMVVDYKGKPGDFVFRRWVAQLSDIFEGIDIIQEKGKPFQGLHNTNMKEDGKWFPLAEDMESVISYAYNKVNNLFKTDPENILYVTGKELESNSKAEQLMQYYAGNQKALDNIVGSLPNNLGKMRKLPTSGKATNEWIELGKYKEAGMRPNNTPKTDVFSDKARISFKKAGGSQLMSGYEQEARATLMYAAQEIGDESIIQQVESLFEQPWLRNINSSVESEARANAQIRNRDLTKTVKDLFANKEFKRLVLLEAASGAAKYGKNSDNTADHVFVWDMLNPGKNKLYTIEQYVDHIFDQAQVLISLKTATKTSTALRITTK